MARFKKSTVVLLTAGTLTLGSLGVLASQQGTPGTFGHDTWERINSTYNYGNTSTKNHNWSDKSWFDRNWSDKSWFGKSWFDRWRGHQNDRSMMHRDCSCGMCRQAGRIQGARADSTLPPIDNHSPNGGRDFSTTELSGANQQDFGRSLVADIGCQGCHQIGRSGGMFGPPLNNVVSRQGEAFVHSKLENPKFETGYSKMPDFNLSSEEITAIVAYLATLDDA
jgi:hypothetical protein